MIPYNMGKLFSKKVKEPETETVISFQEGVPAIHKSSFDCPCHECILKRVRERAAELEEFERAFLVPKFYISDIYPYCYLGVVIATILVVLLTFM